MKIYIAAPYPARELVGRYSVELAEQGHECTSKWALGTREIHAGTVGPSADTEWEAVIKHAADDLNDVFSSDAVIALTGDFVIRQGVLVESLLWLHTGGRQVEIGYALAQDIPVVVVGEPENIFQRGLCMGADSFQGALEVLLELPSWALGEPIERENHNG